MGLVQRYLKPDNESSVDYFSRKQKYTVHTLAVVGSNLIFLDVATGFPGSIHDATMLGNKTISSCGGQYDFKQAK